MGETERSRGEGRRSGVKPRGGTDHLVASGSVRLNHLWRVVTGAVPKCFPRDEWGEFLDFVQYVGDWESDIQNQIQNEIGCLHRKIPTPLIRENAWTPFSTSFYPLPPFTTWYHFRPFVFRAFFLALVQGYSDSPHWESPQSNAQWRHRGCSWICIPVVSWSRRQKKWTAPPTRFLEFSGNAALSPLFKTISKKQMLKKNSVMTSKKIDGVNFERIKFGRTCREDIRSFCSNRRIFFFAFNT